MSNHEHPCAGCGEDLRSRPHNEDKCRIEKLKAEVIRKDEALVAIIYECEQGNRERIYEIALTATDSVPTGQKP